MKKNSLSKNLKSLFLSSKEKRLKSAFYSIGMDMKNMESSQDDLKKSVHEWIMYLNQENIKLRAQIEKLENRLYDSYDIDDDENEAITVLNTL